ncbi:MAG: exodeoxyribonuclease VII large subunit [Cyanobacteria bacterium REEB459]|nr:exodeoxyribonuclease VII large subunit [Cyanobacteria bacterium REEB459]
MTFSQSTLSAPPLSVGGLVDYIQAVLENDPVLHQVWVVGEVSSVTQHPKGLFFNLTDTDTRATIGCVAWRSQWNRLATQPGVGDQVTLLGTVKVYPQRSNYQLTVWQILPSGDGLRAWRYRQLKQRLQMEGVFDAAAKRPLPPLPRAIAVVSSPQAAAWGDIQRSLRHHHPGLKVLFSPATVQGETAPLSIVQAIHRVAMDGRAEVLILARGGGASEDLECFDDERVVRAVASCPIPVVTGIGHERDESLADLAADVCAHTPTAAAIAAVPALADLVVAQAERRHRLHTVVQHQLQNRYLDLEGLRQRLLRQRLDQQLQQRLAYLGQIKARLRQSLQVKWQQASDRQASLDSRLRNLEPGLVLQRGYALVKTLSGQVVTDVASLTPQQTLRIQLAKGQLSVQVIALEPDDDC